MHRALGDAGRNDDIGAILLHQLARRLDEVLDHGIVIGGNVRQIESGVGKSHHLVLHAVAPHERHHVGKLDLVISDQSDPVAEQRRQVQRRLHRTDDRDVDGRAAPLHPEIEKPERHDRVVALLFRLAEGRDHRRLNERNLGRREAKQVRRDRRGDDADLDFGRRIRQGHLLAARAFFRWVIADDKRNSGHFSFSRSGFSMPRLGSTRIWGD